MDYLLQRLLPKWNLWEVDEGIDNLIMYGVVKQSWITNYTYIYNNKNELLFKIAESNFFLCMPAYFVDILRNEKIKSRYSFLNGIYFVYKNINYHFIYPEIRYKNKQWLYFGNRLFANNELVLEVNSKRDYAEIEVLFKSANLEHVILIFISLIMMGANVQI